MNALSCYGVGPVIMGHRSIVGNHNKHLSGSPSCIFKFSKTNHNLGRAILDFCRYLVCWSLPIPMADADINTYFFLHLITENIQSPEVVEMFILCQWQSLILKLLMAFYRSSLPQTFQHLMVLLGASQHLDPTRHTSMIVLVRCGFNVNSFFVFKLYLLLILPT